MNKMKVCLLLTVLTLISASDDFNTNEIKRRMKLIGGIPSYGVQNAPTKMEVKSKDDDIKYTDPELDLNYQASARFNPKGMGHLYYVTKYFMDLIQPNQSYPDDLLIYDNNNVKLGDYKEKWPQWVLHYVGIVSVVAVGLIFAIMMPILGLFFCCCRCGGKCGARSKHEKQHDSCKRTTIAILLSGVSVMILFGVVCAFVTNEYMKEGIEQLENNITVNLNDAELYLENTEKEVDHLLVKNFEQLRKHLTQRLNDAGDIVKDQLAVVSHAIALKNLTDIVAGMEIVRHDLTKIQGATTKLQELASTLGDDLDVTREELLQELRSCRDILACRELLNHRHIAELKVIENFNELLDKYFPKLPDVTRTLETITRLLGDHRSIHSVQMKVLEGQRNFNNIKYEISESVQSVNQDFENAFKTTGEELTKISNKIKQALHAARDLINTETRDRVALAGNYINDYAIYRYYLGLGVSGALLLILLCLTMGLLCGICGKRPEEMYSDDGDCCNTVSGSRFLMIAVWLIFLFSTVLMLIALAHFLLGVGSDIAVCQPLKNPSDNKIFSLVDKFINLKSINPENGDDLKLSEVIISFRQNKTIYEALKLKNMVNIDEVEEYIKNFLPQTQQINQFKNRIKVRTDKLELLGPDARAQLRDLAESPLNDFHFEKYEKVLNFQITNLNLSQLSQELRTNADKIPEQASSGFNLTKVKKLLRAKARFLELLQRESVAQIRNQIQILKANITTLKEHLKFNHTSLKEALENLLQEVESAQTYLRKNGTNELRSLLDSFIQQITEKVKEYLKRVVTKTKEDIGKTGPLSNAYNASLVAGCNRIMDPFNGFWISVGWSVLLFIPVIILAVKLATLYSKSEAYGPPGVYSESEYLYDAYADRDNMPLAMAQADKKKKNHHKNYQESYENSGSGAYLQDYSAHLGRSDRASASNEARYNDMAPKHWGDYSNSRGGSSGPPRYHHPSSTEYERPPPYYYPGPERA